MILAIDIGNTSIKMALMQGQRVRKEVVILGLEKKSRVNQKSVRAIRSFARQFPKIEDIIICSVVPGYLKTLEPMVKNYFRKKPLVLNRNIKVPIKNNYHRPRQVGADRLVGAYAAKMLYKEPLIVIDFGTAITFDVVNERGQYDGGVIVPGIRLSAQSLSKKTALLPNILHFKPPSSVVGKNTQDSILSGLFYGYAALCSGLIRDITARMKKKPRVILTGGHTKEMKRFLKKKVTQIDEHLVLKGLSLIYAQTKAS